MDTTTHAPERLKLKTDNAVNENVNLLSLTLEMANRVISLENILTVSYKVTT